MKPKALPQHKLQLSGEEGDRHSLTHTHLLRAFAPSRSPSTSPHCALSGQQEECILAEWAVSRSQARRCWAVARRCHSQRSGCYSTHGPQFFSQERQTWHSPAHTSQGEQSMVWGRTAWYKRIKHKVRGLKNNSLGIEMRVVEREVQLSGPIIVTGSVHGHGRKHSFSEHPPTPHLLSNTRCSRASE